MTEDSKDLPPQKLKLQSKKSTSSDASQSAPSSPAEEPTPAEKSNPMRLKPREAETEDPITSGLVEPSESSVPPTEPMSDSIKEGEIGTDTRQPLKLLKPNSSPQPATAAATEHEPIASDAPSDELEKPISSLSEQDESKTAPQAGSGGLLIVLLTIAVLFLLLGGASYGIWAILNAPTEKTTADTSEDSQPAPEGPIAKAKAAIEKIHVADVDAITGEDEIAPTRQPVATPPPQTNAAPKPQTSAAPTPQTSPSPPPQTSAAPPDLSERNSNKQKVSDYLSNLHIDGARRGESPAVMIGGKLFGLGDVVNTTLGLKFAGFRDSKLGFEDSNGIIYLKTF